MQIDMKRALYVPACDDSTTVILRVVQRMLTPYLDLVLKDAAQANADDVVLEVADNADDLLMNLSAALFRCGEMDAQEELCDFADSLAEAVQVALDTIEDADSFLTAVSACLAQLYSADQVVLTTEDREVNYEVVYRALRGEEEYAVLVPADGEDDAMLILRCLYPEGADAPAFENGDEEIAEDVYAEFMTVFADEFDMPDEQGDEN